MQIDATEKPSTVRTDDLQACRSQVASVKGQLMQVGGLSSRRKEANGSHLLSLRRRIRDAHQAAGVRTLPL